MRARHALLIALIPALAVAAPKGRHKPGKAGKATAATKGSAADAGKGAGSASEPTPADGAGSAATTPDATAAPATPATPTMPTLPPATPPASGPGAGSAASAPADKPDQATEAAPDVDALRQEYLALRDELFKSRARANAVASQLYSTRVSIRFTWGSGRFYGVSKASIRLDGATVYEDATGAIAGDDGVRFDGYVAPGKHLVTFHVEATGKDDDSFTSATESQVVVKAVAGKDLVVAAKGRDGGDIAYAWKRGEHGSYALAIDVGVKTVAAGTGGGKGARK